MYVLKTPKGRYVANIGATFLLCQAIKFPSLKSAQEKLEMHPNWELVICKLEDEIIIKT